MNVLSNLVLRLGAVKESVAHHENLDNSWPLACERRAQSPPSINRWSKYDVCKMGMFLTSGEDVEEMKR